ncbi:MAG: iron-sulfur cluster assembly accessory protein [Verrucomicrobiota bacterium]
MIQITEAAAKQIVILATESGIPEAGLRIFIEPGGCSGLQYSMQIAEQKDGDESISSGDARVFLDESSATYLKGSTIDYSDSLSSTGFRIQNPNAKQTCGCGTSFEA